MAGVQETMGAMLVGRPVLVLCAVLGLYWCCVLCWPDPLLVQSIPYLWHVSDLLLQQAYSLSDVLFHCFHDSHRHVLLVRVIVLICTIVMLSRSSLWH